MKQAADNNSDSSSDAYQRVASNQTIDSKTNKIGTNDVQIVQGLIQNQEQRTQDQEEESKVNLDEGSGQVVVVDAIDDDSVGGAQSTTNRQSTSPNQAISHFQSLRNTRDIDQSLQPASGLQANSQGQQDNLIIDVGDGGLERQKSLRDRIGDNWQNFLQSIRPQNRSPSIGSHDQDKNAQLSEHLINQRVPGQSAVMAKTRGPRSTQDNMSENGDDIHSHNGGLSLGILRSRGRRKNHRLGAALSSQGRHCDSSPEPSSPTFLDKLYYKIKDEFFDKQESNNHTDLNSPKKAGSLIGVTQNGQLKRGIPRNSSLASMNAVIGKKQTSNKRVSFGGDLTQNYYQKQNRRTINKADLRKKRMASSNSVESQDNWTTSINGNNNNGPGLDKRAHSDHDFNIAAPTSIDNNDDEDISSVCNDENLNDDADDANSDERMNTEQVFTTDRSGDRKDAVHHHNNNQDQVSSDVPSSTTNLADTLAERAQQIKQYASDMSDKISERYSEIQTQVKAYIGTIDNVPEHQLDNRFILSGYRINHDTMRSLCRSLFTCHNEFVNVWSHIGGVFVFISLLITLCIVVLPNQFWYAKTISEEYALIQTGAFPDEKLKFDNPVAFVDSKIDLLEAHQSVLQLMSVDTSVERSEFESQVTDIMYRIEGISHFSIENFYTFDYLTKQALLFDYTYEQAIDTWHDTFTGYNAILLDQLSQSQIKINWAQRQRGHLSIDSYILRRYNFLQERIGSLDGQLTVLKASLLKQITDSPPDPASTVAKTDYLNNLESKTAPDFLDADSILNEVPIWPLCINIFSACFCMGCSAIYHLLSAKSASFQTNLSRLDYAGISILIFGSSFPILYYAMACEQTIIAKNIYMSILGLGCFACFIVTLIPQFDKPQYQKVRGVMYIILGLSTGSMFIMFAFMHPYITPHSGLVYALGGYIYIQGAIIYMIRCPERCSPGKFDFCGASHQIFHFCVLGAALLHYSENYKIFRSRQLMECPIWQH